MKQLYTILFVLLFMLIVNKEFAQSNEPTKLFRFYEDDDFFNITGKGTDKSYTNGTRLDFFYQKKSKSQFFLDKMMPAAGDSSNNIYGWSIMQIMKTPNDISATNYQANDYAYAGALFAIHSFYSFNSQRKYDFQTKLIAGVRGPASFAKQMQTGFHSLIHYQRPMGWSNELRTAPLININFIAEKQFLSIGNFAEINGGAVARAGSLWDEIIVYPMIRIGKMAPYFSGYLNQFSSFERNGRQIKTQYYFVLQPMETFVAYDAMVEGRRENQNSHVFEFNANQRTKRIQNRVSDIQFGAVVVHGNFGISYTQTYTSAYNKGLYKHSVGNMSLYFSW